MRQKPVKLDFNIEHITLEGSHYNASLLTKALIRFSKVVLNERKRVLLLYPNFCCSSLPLLVISSYYCLLNNNIRPKILLVTNRKETITQYKEFGNERGYPFVDFIYSGTMNRGIFNRLKPVGSGKGKIAGKIKQENCSVLLSNFNLNSISKYDLILIEDAQILAKPRYKSLLSCLANCHSPLLAVQTCPNLKLTLSLQKNLACLVWGWSEDLVKKDLLLVCNLKNTLDPEARFPEIKFQHLPTDEYSNMLSLAKNAFLKSNRLRFATKHEPENLSRIFIDLAWLVRQVQNLVVPITDLIKIENEHNLMPIPSRIALMRSSINNLPEKINEKLELENIVTLCESALQNEPTKGKEIASFLSKQVACCVVSIDKLQHESLLLRFPNFYNCIHYYKVEPQGCHDSAYVIGLTGSVEKDYSILKWPNADKITIPSYSFEIDYYKRLDFNRQQVATLLENRADVLRYLNPQKYS